MLPYKKRKENRQSQEEPVPPASPISSSSLSDSSSGSESCQQQISPTPSPISNGEIRVRPVQVLWNPYKPDKDDGVEVNGDILIKQEKDDLEDITNKQADESDDEVANRHYSPEIYKHLLPLGKPHPNQSNFIPIHFQRPAKPIAHYQQPLFPPLFPPNPLFSHFHLLANLQFLNPQQTIPLSLVGPALPPGSAGVLPKRSPPPPGLHSASLTPIPGRLRSSSPLSTERHESSTRRSTRYEDPEPGRRQRDQETAKNLNMTTEEIQQVIQMTMEEFNDFCQKKHFNDEQMNQLRDMRRRGKNKVAAQNCRKRKLMNIDELQTKVDKKITENQSLKKEFKENELMKEEWVKLFDELTQRIKQENNEEVKCIEHQTLTDECKVNKECRILVDIFKNED